ncbi:PAS domain-containing protein [Streptomyces sp. DSM 44915]|uniref:PAS domain-containing protein n=1 Tax=Streptomyces chisholmiae TaxID=3075540 RepID=A0ABU2JT87_9ACTN|nr:PAS domain-containing protein [Streptomyces sp. DSM 44915]MDT0268203.1 PAS domain-containing protein [Streptomyces sp. DSM 44915]
MTTHFEAAHSKAVPSGTTHDDQGEDADHSATTGRPDASGESASARQVSDQRLLSALLGGMEAALFALDGSGRITHWNQRATALLGWTAGQAVGRPGLGGWLVREADAAEVTARLLAVLRDAPAAAGGPARRVSEIPLLRADGSRVLMRATVTAVRDREGRPVGAYCAFGEALAQLDLERHLALSDALLAEAPFGVLLVDADLRTVAANGQAADALSVASLDLLGEPLAEFFVAGLDELESALEHTLAGQPPQEMVELWLTRGDDGFPEPAPFDTRPVEPRRCLRSGFLRLGSPVVGDPAPLGVAWVFQDITHAKRAGQDAARQRFRDSQLSRASRAAADCADPLDAALLHLHYALPGFAEHVLLDVTAEAGGLVRLAESPGGLLAPAVASGVAVRYRAGHPALQAVDCGVPVRATGGVARSAWARDHRWPIAAEHALCVPVRSRGRALGALTFLRGGGRRAFDRLDAGYGEEVALRVGAVLDLARLLAGR